jgi:hypothetical protein
VDGERSWRRVFTEASEIPIIPVIAQEVISEVRRRYITIIRYSRDPQAMINATMSKTMAAVSTINEAPFIGRKRQFKDVKGRDGKRHFYYLEAEPTTAAHLGKIVARMAPTKHMLDMFHASKLPVQSAALAPEPQPQGAPQ